ncbi:retrovirus-related pol polyprotein from transposon TNT 1-94, partial [Tanacetum coccineum]
NHYNGKPKFIRSDNGTKIVNKACLALFNSLGIVHQRSMVYTPQQNGVVERKHRHLLDTARALQLHANLPNKFWGDCILAATYLINKMPMKILDWKSPYEILHKTAPSYENLRTIGCLCYAAVTKPHKDKFEPRGNRCVLIGYPPRQKGYKLYDLQTKEVFCSRDVIFKEDKFPFKEPELSSPISTSSFKTWPIYEEVEEKVSVTPQSVPNTQDEIHEEPAQQTEPIIQEPAQQA